MGVDRNAWNWVGARFSIIHFIIVCFYHVKYTFTKNLHSVIACRSRNSLVKTGTISED